MGAAAKVALPGANSSTLATGPDASPAPPASSTVPSASGTTIGSARVVAGAPTVGAKKLVGAKYSGARRAALLEVDGAGAPAGDDVAGGW